MKRYIQGYKTHKGRNKMTFWTYTKVKSKFWKWLRKNPKARGLY